MRNVSTTHQWLLVLPSLFLAGLTNAHENHACADDYPDSPALAHHVEQFDIANGSLSWSKVISHGAALFATQFNVCDGQGRPAATGTGVKRTADEPSFSRASAPDSNACAGCHNLPLVGGAGDFVANVFVLAQAQDPVVDSTSALFSNNRNTLGMFGSGPIEMLAREMSLELQYQASQLGDGDHVLNAKGVEFAVTMLGGEVIAASGVDTDLVIKPFHQAGVVTSLREFSTNAMNHHHGMQAEERFDLNPAKNFDVDHDEDGVARELTVGDITAITLWQAQLPVPTQVLPRWPRDKQRVRAGETLFSQIGCAGCHQPQLMLESRKFVEPNPFNPAGTCSDPALCPAVSFDMTQAGPLPRLEGALGGGAIVRAYTDLKRHNLCDPVDQPDAIRHFCNEQLAQGRPVQDGRPGQEFFLTRKLWDVGNSAPYGHRGDLTTITAAIHAHGGEARAERDNFTALGVDEQRAIIQFLRTLQVVASPGQ